MRRGNVVNFFVAAAFLLTAGMCFGEEKYLITMPGPKPALAKSFKSVGPGTYEFVIDPSKTIKGGKKPTFDNLKDSLTKKKLVKEVKGDASKITVTYEGDENSFLEKIAKTRIKGSGGDVDLALESSVSDGGVRARTAAREPKAGEVKGKIIGKSNGSLKVMVQKKGTSGVPEALPMMRPISVKSGNYEGMPGQTIFFKPTKKTGDLWEGKDFTDK